MFEIRSHEEPTGFISDGTAVPKSLPSSLVPLSIFPPSHAPVDPALENKPINDTAERLHFRNQFERPPPPTVIPDFPSRPTRVVRFQMGHSQRDIVHRMPEQLENVRVTMRRIDGESGSGPGREPNLQMSRPNHRLSISSNSRLYHSTCSHSQREHVEVSVCLTTTARQRRFASILWLMQRDFAQR